MFLVPLTNFFVCILGCGGGEPWNLCGWRATLPAEGAAGSVPLPRVPGPGTHTSGLRAGSPATLSDRLPQGRQGHAHCRWVLWIYTLIGCGIMNILLFFFVWSRRVGGGQSGKLRLSSQSTASGIICFSIDVPQEISWRGHSSTVRFIVWKCLHSHDSESFRPHLCII